MSEEKQFELMYNDMVITLTDRKRAVFDLTKWIVTLHGLSIGFSTIKAAEIGIWFLGAPILIGLAGLALNRSIQMEMYSHRVAMAKIRDHIGGEFYEIHKEMVDKFLERKGQVKLGYWDYISGSHSFIIIISTMVSVVVGFNLLE